jgi:hypothetical protein
MKTLEGLFIIIEICPFHLRLPIITKPGTLWWETVSTECPTNWDVLKWDALWGNKRASLYISLDSASLGCCQPMILTSCIKMVLHTGLKECRKVFLAGLRDPCTREVARLSEIVKYIISLSESRATSQVHGSCYPARQKPLGNCFIKLLKWNEG